MPRNDLRPLRPFLPILVFLLSVIAAWASFPQSEVLLPDTVYVTATTRQNDRLFLGTTSAGLWSYDLRRRELKDEAVRELRGKKITALASGHRSGEVWAGSFFDGLYLVSGSAATSIRRQSHPELPSDRITALHRTADALWIGTHQGLAVLRGTTLQKILDENVKCLTGDASGRRIWVGHGAGRVSLVENGRPRSLDLALPSSPTIRSLSWDEARGRLLLGTFSGLYQSGPRLDGLVDLTERHGELRLVNMLVTRGGRSFFSVPGRKGGIREIKGDGSFVDTFNSYQGYSEATDMHLWPEGEYVIISFGKLWHLTRELQNQGLAAVDLRRSLGFARGSSDDPTGSPSTGARPRGTTPSVAARPARAFSPSGALPPRIGVSAPSASRTRAQPPRIGGFSSPRFETGSPAASRGRAAPPRIGAFDGAPSRAAAPAVATAPGFRAAPPAIATAPISRIGSVSPGGGSLPPQPVVRRPGVSAVAATLGRIWFGTTAGELLSWTPGSEARLERRFDGAIQTLHISPGGLWISTNRGELIRFNGFAYRSVPLPAGPDGQPGQVGAVASRERKTWFATDRGIFLQDGEKGTWAAWGARDLGLRSSQFFCLAVDGRGRIWAGCSEGLLEGGLEGWRLHDRRAGLPQGAIRSVMVDDRSGVWCATTEETAHWDGQAWERFPGVGALWLAPSRKGDVLAGGQGLQRLRAGERPRPERGLEGLRVADGAETIRGLILAGPEGLYLIEGRP